MCITLGWGIGHAESGYSSKAPIMFVGRAANGWDWWKGDGPVCRERRRDLTFAPGFCNR